jgi:predicted amidohydrolase
MRVGVIQLCSTTDVDANIEVSSNYIRQAAQDGVQFIATPEMTPLLQKDKSALLLALHTPEKDPALKAYAALAKDLGIFLLIGSVALKVGEKVSNRSYLFAPDGSLNAQYDKIHLFDAQVSDTERYRESATYHAGEVPVLANLPSARLGLSICYDLRFPALYRHYAQKGAQIMAVPAAFTVPTGRAHWDVLLRARAIETGSFIMAPAQGGHHQDGRKTYGHSKIINPWGDIIAELAHDRPGYICADLDLSEVDEARKHIPAWADNRIYP